MIHRPHNQQALEHQGMTHSQSVVMDEGLLMTAPAAHHRKEEHSHELVIRAPGVVQQHQSHVNSVISNTASLEASTAASAEEYDRRATVGRIHGPTSVERRDSEEKPMIEEPIQATSYSSNYRFSSDGCFQTVLQVKIRQVLIGNSFRYDISRVHQTH